MAKYWGRVPKPTERPGTEEPREVSHHGPQEVPGLNPARLGQNQPPPPTTHQAKHPLGLPRLKDIYNIDEGRLKCNCLLRKWKFCPTIKKLADGKIGKQLIQSFTTHDIYPTQPREYLLENKLSIIKSYNSKLLQEYTNINSRHI